MDLKSIQASLNTQNTVHSSSNVGSNDEILTNKSLFVCNGSVKDGNIDSDMQNMFSPDNIREQNQVQAIETNSLPFYLITASNSNNIERFTVSGDSQENTNKIADGSTEAFAIYPAVTKNNSQLISFISKNNASVSSIKDYNHLSPKVFNGFILENSDIATSQAVAVSVNTSSDTLQSIQSPSSCFSLAIVDDDACRKDFGLQTVELSSDNKKEVIIITDDIQDDSEDTFEEMSIQSSNSKVNEFFNVEDNTRDSQTIETVRLEPASTPNCNRLNMLKDGTISKSSAKLLTVEELLNSQPVLHMDFNIENEIADFNSGVTIRREVTTQTVPLRKPQIRRKKTAKPIENAVPSNRHTPELKVILTTDDDPDINDELVDENEMEELSNAEYKPYKCPLCSLRFLDEETLVVHIKCHPVNVMDNKRYSCYVCGFISSQWVKMYNHLFTHGLKKPYKCDQCSFSCVAKNDLVTHMYVHSTAKQWNCPKCNRLFKHRRNMKTHLRNCLGLDDSGKPIKHALSKEFVCRICHKQLANKRSLDKHMEIHLDVKPFVCNLCGHATRLKESLLTHKRVHTGEKPFKCDVCSYSTSDKSALRRHKRKHTNEKPYSCKFCDYKAIQKHCLDNHIHRKHTGEKFICGLCNYETYHQYALNQHFKHHHQDEFSTAPEESCIVTPAVVISNSNGEPVNSSNFFISLPESTPQPTVTTHKLATVPGETQELTVPGNSVLQNHTNPASSSLVGDSQSSQKQAAIEVMQQIQQPGDFVIIQNNGSILIRKEDGRMLIIQQMEEDNEVEPS